MEVSIEGPLKLEAPFGHALVKVRFTLDTEREPRFELSLFPIRILSMANSEFFERTGRYSESDEKLAEFRIPFSGHTVFGDPRGVFASRNTNAS